MDDKNNIRLLSQVIQEEIEEYTHLQLAKKMLKRGHNINLQIPEGCHKEEGKHLFCLTAESRTWTNGQMP